MRLFVFAAYYVSVINIKEVAYMAEKCADIIMPCGDSCMKAGYAFVPIQNVNRFYDFQSAMVAGTVFPDLNMPKGKYGPKENACE